MIDIHTHIGGVRSWARNLKGMVYVTVDELLEYMDDVGLDLAVVLPIARKILELGEDVALTEEVIELCRRSPDRLIPFCSIHPEDPDAISKIKKYVDMGCRGFGEHKVKLNVADRRSKRIYEACGEIGMPVLLHMDDAYNPDIFSFKKVASELPSTTFIIHGPGWWREISKNVDRRIVYPDGKVEPGGKAEEILKKYPNVYADISAFSGLNALQRDLEFAKGFVERNWRKLIFGTDFPCLHSDGGQYGPNRLHINLLKKLSLDQEIYKAITYGNAKKLLNLGY